MAVLSRTSTARATTRRHHTALALWHLLSLDAPSVAALWTWFIAASVHIQLSLTSVIAMAVAVWMLYAADRLLDARHLAENPLHIGDLELRHRFHHRHRSGFLAGILAASVALAILIPRLAPSAIYLYLVLGALLAGYFILIHATGSANRLPKELAVGIFFASAVFVPTVARAPHLRLALLGPALLFALLCSLNCLFIYSWEHRSPHSSTITPHPATRFALRHLTPLAILSLATDLLLASLHLASIPHLHPLSWTLPVACALSSAVLLLLDRHRNRMQPLTLRAAADLALLTPMLLLPTLRSLHP